MDSNLKDKRDKPLWWRKNEEIKDEYGSFSFEYEPSRFADNIYTHEIVDNIERTRGCEIQFIGVNTRYLDDWEVRIDGQTVFSIGRHRDENGNTVYEMTSDEFKRKVHEELANS